MALRRGLVQGRGAGLLIVDVDPRAAGDQQPGHVRVAAPGGLVERRRTGVVGAIGLCVAVEQHPGDLDMIAAGGEVERRRTVGRARADVGAVGQQDLHDSPAVHEGGVVQRRRARLLVPRVDVGVMFDQQFDDPRVPAPGGVKQRRAAERVVFVDVRAAREQRGDGVDVAGARRRVGVGSENEAQQQRRHRAAVECLFREYAEMAGTRMHT